MTFAAARRRGKADGTESKKPEDLLAARPLRRRRNHFLPSRWTNYCALVSPAEQFSKSSIASPTRNSDPVINTCSGRSSAHSMALAKSDIEPHAHVASSARNASANSSGRQVRSLRTGTATIRAAIGNSAAAMPGRCLSFKTPTTSVAFSAPFSSLQVCRRQRAAAGLCAPSTITRSPIRWNRPGHSTSRSPRAIAALSVANPATSRAWTASAAFQR